MSIQFLYQLVYLKSYLFGCNKVSLSYTMNLLLAKGKGEVFVSEATVLLRKMSFFFLDEYVIFR